jgi:hypothetical protein
LASSPCSDTVEKCIEGVSKSTSAEETCVGVIKLILTGAWTGVGRTTVKGATITVRAVGNYPPDVVTAGILGILTTGILGILISGERISLIVGNWKSGKPLTTGSRTSLTATITANTVIILTRAMLCRWSSESEGGERESDDGFDELHGVEESGKRALLERGGRGLCFIL